MIQHENAEKVMTQFKSELELMKKEAKEGDSMPAEVFFAFMDVLVPVFDGVIERNLELEEKLNECK